MILLAPLGVEDFLEPVPVNPLTKLDHFISDLVLHVLLVPNLRTGLIHECGIAVAVQATPGTTSDALADLEAVPVLLYLHLGIEHDFAGDRCLGFGRRDVLDLAALQTGPQLGVVSPVVVVGFLALSHDLMHFILDFVLQVEQPLNMLLMLFLFPLVFRSLFPVLVLDNVVQLSDQCFVGGVRQFPRDDLFGLVMSIEIGIALF